MVENKYIVGAGGMEQKTAVMVTSLMTR